MRTKGTASFTTYTLIAVLGGILAAGAQQASARGMINSSGSDDRGSNYQKSDERSNSRSDARATTKPSQNHTTRTENRSNTTPAPSPSARQEERRYERSSAGSKGGFMDRGSYPYVARPQEQRSVPEAPRMDLQRRQGTGRSQDSQRNEGLGSRRTGDRTLSSVVRQRDERRDSYSDRRDRNRRHDEDTRSYRSHEPRFRFYAYNYRPSYTYRSLYYYYSGYCPPYIDRVRVIVVPLYVRSYCYTDLPLLVDYDDGYYLAHPRDDSYTYVLRDIRNAWKRGSFDLISDYIRSDAKVAIFNRGEYSYSIDGQDFYDMTRDAMDALQTKSFEFYKIQRRSDDRIVAFARHEYNDADDIRKTVYVSYTLERSGGNWYITEAGSSASRFDHLQ